MRSSGRGRVRREAKKTRKGKERGWKEEREKGKKRGEFRPMVVFKSRRHDCISTFSRHLFTTLCDVLCERNWWLMCSSLLRIAGIFSRLHSAKPKMLFTSTERSYDMSSLYLRQKNRPKAGLWTRMKIVSSVVSCGPSSRIVQFSRISRINLVWGPYGSRTILTRARILERLCYHTLVAISDIVLVITVLRWSVKIW